MKNKPSIARRSLLATAFLTATTGQAGATGASFEMRDQNGNAYPADGWTYVTVYAGVDTDADTNPLYKIDLTHAVLVISPTSQRTTLPDGRLRISDQSGKNNHAYAPAGRVPEQRDSPGGQYTLGGVTYPAGTRTFSYFDGASGPNGPPILEVPTLTTASLPQNERFSIIMQICPESSGGVDPTQINAATNGILTLGGPFTSPSARPWLAIMQKAGTNNVYTDYSGGVTGTTSAGLSALRETVVQSGTCAVVASVRNIGSSLDSVTGYLSYNTSFQGRTTLSTVSTTAGQPLRIGGDGTTDKVATGLRIGWVVVYKNATVNRQIVALWNRVMQQSAGMISEVPVLTALSPLANDTSGALHPSITTWCSSNPTTCVRKTVAENSATCTTFSNATPAASCGAALIPFNPATLQHIRVCTSFNVPATMTGLPLLYRARAFDIDSTTGVTTKSDYSNPIRNCNIIPQIP